MWVLGPKSGHMEEQQSLQTWVLNKTKIARQNISNPKSFDI